MKVKEVSEKADLKSTFKKLRSWDHRIPVLMPYRRGESGSSDTLFSWAPKSLGLVTIAVKLKGAAAPWKENLTNLDSLLKSRNITLWTKVHIFKAAFSR